MNVNSWVQSGVEEAKVDLERQTEYILQHMGQIMPSEGFGFLFVLK